MGEEKEANIGGKKRGKYQRSKKRGLLRRKYRKISERGEIGKILGGRRKKEVLIFFLGGGQYCWEEKEVNIEGIESKIY